ncbi:hypothetical protein [Streptomyces solaniscabiei]|uniref:hypothetical protein n=1 Tax=Streptomyces solaniscabiei TaxID=2683255 RepID=UPI001CE39367|nr:hypothetical protein [Streptomyces solaniscabiei]
MTDVKIIDCTDPTELYRHYDGQSEAQDAYIELDLHEGTLLADYDAEIGNAAPSSVRHGFERRYGIPVLTADAANRVMREIAQLANRILADWEEVWNGHNMVAQLGEDAQAAEAEIKEQLGLTLGYGDLGVGNQGFGDGDVVAEWDINGATNGSEVEEYGITAETTDERLDEIEAEITRALAGVSESKVAVVHGLNEYLRDLRRDLAVQSA